MIKILIALFIITSCATKPGKNFFSDEPDTPDLAKEFNIEKDKIKGFEVKSTINKNESKKILKKIVKKKKQKKKSIKKEVKEEKKVVQEKKDELPDDYPKNYVAYDEKYKRFWDDFTPTFYPGEEFVMTAKFLGMTVGHISLYTKPLVEISGTPSYRFTGRIKSASFFNTFYTLDDKIESYINAESFLPIKYSLIQRESGQNVDDLQLFDSKKKKTFVFYKKLKRGKKKEYEISKYIPEYFHDSFSALYFIRGMPLQPGDKYEFPILTRGKLWILKMDVVDADEVKVKDKWIPAVKLKAETHFPGVLKKSGDIHFWFSKDEKRLFLKFEAKVKIGSLEGTLVDYKEGEAL